MSTDESTDWEREISDTPGPPSYLLPTLARIAAALCEAKLEAARQGWTRLPAEIYAIERRVYSPESWA